MRVQIVLHDGSKATLQRIVQDDNYRHGYPKMPEDPIAELEAAARMRLPEYWPVPSKRRVKIVIPDECRLREAFEQGREKWMNALPPIISVGEFWSLRDPEGEGKNTFLTLAWLQDDMSPHISDENRNAMRRINWDDEVQLAAT
ncbi:hypothetical protein BH10PLA1_BH10PLA1_06940 [soil metagenome]